jgi:uncharacterized membrane protein
MKKYFSWLSVFLFCFLIITPVHANDFFKGEVLEITQEGEEEIFGTTQLFQEFDIKITSGNHKNEIIPIEKGDYSIVTEEQKLKVGDNVVLKKREGSFYITDKYRLGALLGICLLFVAFAVGFGRKRGFMSLVGLAFSFFIILKFIVPQILNGQNPLVVSLIGGSLISVFSIYLSHGFKKRTTLAVISTIFTFLCAIGISVFFVSWANLFGVSSEEVVFLQMGVGDVDLKGLLLGGILIGILGILDDVTTTQCATVEEIYKANKQTSFAKLYTQGMSVGREHMASMINTLALAYAGVALPLFLLFTFNNDQPLWTILNSEFIAEEIVRTLAGCCALILAVPISTVLSTYFYMRKTVKKRS